jgi:hypothetical protein
MSDPEPINQPQVPLKLLNELCRKLNKIDLAESKKPTAKKITKEEEEKERALRKRVCECGYNPHAVKKKTYAHDHFINDIFLSDENKENKYEERYKNYCSNKLSLRNHIYFPSTKMLADKNVISDHKRHYATLLEIIESTYLVRKSLRGWNQFGEDVSVRFFVDEDVTPNTFKWLDLQVGYTIAILYPDRREFVDGENGLRVDNVEMCYVFEAPLSAVQDEAQKLLNSADAAARSELTECFSCGLKQTDMTVCSKCKKASYCGMVLIPLPFFG